MKLVIQRVTSAKVSVEGKVIGDIKEGCMILCGVKKGDSEEQAANLAEKILNLRLMRDGEMKMNKSILDVKGEILAISQFTLYAETQGRRPGFSDAEEPEKAKIVFDAFVEKLRDSGLKVDTGEFGTYMSVELVNDGPVTIILEG